MADSGERLRLIVGVGVLAVLAAVAAFLVLDDDDVSTEAAPILPGETFAASPSTTPTGADGDGDGEDAGGGPAEDDTAIADPSTAPASAEDDRQVVVVAGSEASSSTPPETSTTTTITTMRSTTANTAPPTTAPPSTSSTTAAPTTAPPTTAAPTSTTQPAPSSTATTAPPSTAAPTTSPPAGNPPGDGSDRDLERRVIDLTNQRRAENGCPPLAANDRLHAAALGHSVDMATQDYFSHTSRDGSSMSDRIDRQGYAWRRLAENIAAGYPSPEAVVEGWMNSSGHRANILNCDLTEIGVGHYQRYWTQNFGTPR